MTHPVTLSVMPVTYPIYYATQRVTMERLIEVFAPKMHPAFAQRLFPWIESCGGLIGIGSGFRYTQPSGTGFAPAGQSFHEYQAFVSGMKKYAAVDLVAFRGEGLTHRSPRWHEVPPQGSNASKVWGVHCNVGGPDGEYNWDVSYGGEPWHMQPIELDGWTRWVNGGRKDPVMNYPIPASPIPTPPYEPPTSPVTPPPPSTGGSVTVDPLTLKPGAADKNWTEKLQCILPTFGQDVGPADGIYGPRTQQAVKNVQAFFGLTVDAIVGPKTWTVILGVAP